jgi:8-oxo-dGTP pyrophosphatase MutT (NUDIX family)
MIGGAAESDEQPEATIVRECCEETGIQIVSPKFFVRFLTFWHEESVFIHQLTQTNPVIRLGEGVEYYFFRPEAILGLKTAFYTAPICALYKLAFPETLAP